VSCGICSRLHGHQIGQKSTSSDVICVFVLSDEYAHIRSEHKQGTQDIFRSILGLGKAYNPLLRAKVEKTVSLPEFKAYGEVNMDCTTSQ
jgi:hypothetical protein